MTFDSAALLFPMRMPGIVGGIHGLSEDCPGPYWMVGGEVAAVSHVGPAKPPIPEGPEVLFPQHDALPRTDRGGQHLVVKLVLDGGCLRADTHFSRRSSLRHRISKSVLLVWPETFTLSTEDGVVRIVDANGRIAARVGDHVRITSVAVSFQQALDQGLIHGLSEDCPGPYWLAGDEVAAISLDWAKHITVVRIQSSTFPARDNTRRARELNSGSHWRTGPGRPLPSPEIR